MLQEHTMQKYANALKEHGYIEKALEIHFQMRQFA
jgi:hypothetical protein